MNIAYGHIDPAWDGYHRTLISIIKAAKPKRVLEVGGGAHPALQLSELQPLGINEYAILDISERELSKAPIGYNKICQDISGSNLSLTGKYDLIISKMLAEHIKNPCQFHQNIFNILSPDGRAFHFF